MELNITELGDIRESQFAIPENMFPNLENKIIMNENININKKNRKIF
jgi:hypothetical protein